MELTASIFPNFFSASNFLLSIQMQFHTVHSFELSVLCVQIPASLQLAFYWKYANVHFISTYSSCPLL